MTLTLKDYEAVVGTDVIDEIQSVAERVRGRCLQNINSTPVGGGVAEILTRLVPLLRDLGIDSRWDVIKGDQEFFAVTKTFHNA
ncbi:MAG: glycosyl transferase family 1, partial [Bryobacteraceae bacterium]